MELREKLNAIMEERGLSRYKLANDSGIPYTTLIKILDGTTKNPQINNLRALAQHLKIDIDELIGVPAYDGPASSIEEDFKDELFDDEDIRMIAREYKNLSPKSKEFLKKMLHELD